jgi:hypothetical protein
LPSTESSSSVPSGGGSGSGSGIIRTSRRVRHLRLQGSPERRTGDATHAEMDHAASPCTVQINHVVDRLTSNRSLMGRPGHRWGIPMHGTLAH